MSVGYYAFIDARILFCNAVQADFGFNLAERVRDLKLGLFKSLSVAEKRHSMVRVHFLLMFWVLQNIIFIKLQNMIIMILSIVISYSDV